MAVGAFTRETAAIHRSKQRSRQSGYGPKTEAERTAAFN